MIFILGIFLLYTHNAAWYWWVLFIVAFIIELSREQRMIEFFESSMQKNEDKDKP